MNTKKIISIIAFVSLFFVSANAQVRSAYYLDAYSYRHRINPAMPSARSYFIIPVLGDVGLNLSSNLGISTFIYPLSDGRLATFMHPEVSTEQFLSKLSNNNLFDISVDASLLSMGIWGRKGGFTTAEINIRMDETIILPKSLFEFFADPIGSHKHYDMGAIGMRFRNFAELSIGHSHKINKRLNVGAKVKFLLGLMNANVSINDLTIDMTKDIWKLQASASALVSGMVGVNLSPEGKPSAGMKPTIAGYGLAFDLGATYEVIDGLTISAAVLDLGFTTWSHPKEIRPDELTWQFTGRDEISFDSASPNYIGNSFNNLFDDFDNISFHERDVKKSAEMLTCTVNIGAEYKMPFYKKMSVGALVTSNIRGKYTATEGRFSLNVEPTNWFGFAASYGISDYGSTFGTMLLLHSKGITFFLGSDTIPLRYVMSDYSILPRNKFNIGVNLGVVLSIGKFMKI